MCVGTSCKWRQRLFGLWINSSGLQIWLGLEQGWTIFVEYHRRSLPWFYVRAMIYSEPSLTVECKLQSRSFFTVHVSLPYKTIFSTHALKKSSLVFVEVFDCQRMCSLLQAFQAWALRVRKSFMLSATEEPRYLKSSTSLSCVPSLERIEAGHSFPFIDTYSVFLAIE